MALEKLQCAPVHFMVSTVIFITDTAKTTGGGQNLERGNVERPIFRNFNLNFTTLFEKFKYLIWFKSYDFFSKCLHFRMIGVFITKNKILVEIFLQSLWCALKGEVFKCVQEFYQIFLLIIERFNTPWVWNDPR